MPDYSKGKVYKIIDLDTNECYIGSTTIQLRQRLAQHVSDYKSYLRGTRHYVTSFKVLENGDYDIILIEKYPCNDKEELLARERYFIQTTDCVNKVKNVGLINSIGRKDYDKQKHQEYYPEHRKEILSYQKQYYKEHQ